MSDLTNKLDALEYQAAEKYHALRAHTCTILHEHCQIDKNRIQLLTGWLSEIITRVYFNPKQTGLGPDLNEIITAASELGAIVAQAKAKYEPLGYSRVDRTAAFSKSWMEMPCEKLRSDTGFDVLISPSLAK